MEEGNKKSRKTIAIILTALMYLASGCGQKELPEKNVKNAVIECLKLKYGGDFEVESIEKENTGVQFKHYRYKAVVKSLDLGFSFDSYLSIDGKEFFDYYEQSKYEKEIQTEVDSFDPHSKDFNIISTDIDYAANYDEASLDYKDYVSKGNVSVRVKAEVTGNDAKEISESIRGYIENIYDAGYEVAVQLIKGNNIEIVKQSKDKSLVTIELIEERVIFVLGNEK